MTSTNDINDTDRPTCISHPRRNLPILKRIPRGSRTEAATVLHQLLGDVSKDVGNTGAWKRLLGFAPACLTQPGRGGRSHNLTTIVNRQIRGYDGQIDSGIGSDHCKARKMRRATVDDEIVAANRASAKLGRVT